MSDFIMLETCKYKYEVVADAIRRNIRQGHYSTGKLPDEDILIREYGVSKRTISSALKQLSNESVITRVKSKGTFISSRSNQSLTLCGLVGVMMDFSGHYYGTLAKHIRHYLSERLFYMLELENNTTLDKEAERFRNYLFTVLNSRIQGVIYDGNGYCKSTFLREFKDMRSVAVNCFDAPGPIPDCAVLADYRSGMYDMVNHLLERGCRRIMLSVGIPSIFPILDPVHAARHPVNQVIDGYKEAMNKAGLGDYIETNALHDEDVIRGVLMRRQRPEAIVCHNDSMAVKIILNALILGIKVPEELLVSGMYNTPWTTICPVKLTSISLEEEEIARRAVQLLTAPDAANVTELVKPKIIKRESA